MMMWQAILTSSVVALWLSGGEPAAKSRSVEKTPRHELFSGRVVLLKDALEKMDIKVAEEMHGQVVLETDDGELLPILADWRGRAFFQDPRLRERRVELVCFRREKMPYLQVQLIFTFDEAGERMYTDYWCDICAIPMYEIKPCECCQGPIRLRYQPQDLPDYLPPSTRGEKPNTTESR